MTSTIWVLAYNLTRVSRAELSGLVMVPMFLTRFQEDYLKVLS